MSLSEVFQIEKASYFRNPNIGVYIYANNKIAIIPPGTDPDLKELLREVLRVEKIIETKISDLSLIGVMISGNDRGLILPKTIREEELRVIRESFDGNIEILRINANAIGNLIVANSRGALVYKDADSEVIKVVKNVLEVEIVERGELANIPTVGSIVVVTNRGGVVHPDVSRREIERLSEIFGVPFDNATVNFGISFVRSGLVANDKGALVGSNTTGPEILRISKILGIKGLS
ncbi:MAG: translation initiation factor IF-6 [Sulfolobales archaeon]